MTIDRFARLALDCVRREYPNKIAHVLSSDADVRPPRALTPAFFGCFDWHSAVHGHWLLVVAAERTSDASLREQAVAAVSANLRPEAIAAECAYLRARPGFERPYGLAWLFTLHAALSRSPIPALGALAPVLEPLVEVAAAQLRAWLPRLARPTRSGVHSQTAFALGLLLDAARALGRDEDAALYEERARTYFLEDRDLPIHLEPDGEDFLSPALGEADLLARLLAPEPFAAWLDRALPSLGRSERPRWLEPAVVTDPSDGRLVHLDGLNLSRAWMLHGIARALPPDDARLPAIERAAREHAVRGLASLQNEHYAATHWLGTFAAYMTLRGAHPDSSA